MIKSILRLKPVLNRLGCRKTKFEEDYRWHSDDDPYVPGTQGRVKRVKAVPLGVRNIGFLDNEIGELIDGLAAERDVEPAVAAADAAQRRARAGPKQPSSPKDRAKTDRNVRKHSREQPAAAGT
jgi:hypothetical protein